MRLGRADAEDGVEGEAVEVPRRRPGARRAVRRRERVALDLHRPAAIAVMRRERLEGRSIRDPLRLPFEDEVEPGDLAASVQAGFATRLRPFCVPGPIAM